MKLTEEQKRLVEENIGLVHYFCTKNNILDEDIRARFFEKLCYWVTKWDSSKSKLSTFLMTCMHTEYKQVLREYNQDRRKIERKMYSLDYELPLKDGSVSLLEEIVPELNNGIDTFIERQYILEIIEYCKNISKPRDYEIFMQHLKGVRQKDIAKCFELSQSIISRIIIQTQNKMRQGVMI